MFSYIKKSKYFYPQINHLQEGKKIYFLSDFHLGAPDYTRSLERELLVIQFLNSIRKDAEAIFIVGDMFDFWFEYKYVVPKGYTRLLGKLAELSDEGIKLHFFVGNHDMWVKDYFQQELNMAVYFEPAEFTWNQQLFLIGHGDGLGPGDKGYKRLKKLFRDPLAQGLFGILPPRVGMGLANYMSRRSRAKTGTSEEVFLGADKEWLIQYARRRLLDKEYRYFIFGHRHLPIDYRLTENSRYINLGDWLNYYTYAVFDGVALELKSYLNKENKMITG